METIEGPQGQIFKKPNNIKKPDVVLDEYNSVQYMNVPISPIVLMQLCIKSGIAFMVEQGIPKDSVMINFVPDPDRNVFVATFEHPSFDRVEIGKPIPEINVVMTALQVEVMGDVQEKDKN